jgi:hypothetical protein
MCQMVEDMKTSDENTFRQIRALRDQYKADLVGLMVDSNFHCGCGSQFNKWSLNNAEEAAYFVVNTVCAIAQYSFAHEIGHSFVRKMNFISALFFLLFDII